jgi:hypothetical protein
MMSPFPDTLKSSLDLFFGSLTTIGFQNFAIGWNIVYQKMLRFVYVVLYNCVAFFVTIIVNELRDVQTWQDVGFNGIKFHVDDI